MDPYLSLPEGTCKLFFSMTGERVRVLGSCPGLILIVTALPRRSTPRSRNRERERRAPSSVRAPPPPLGVPCAFAHSESASVFIRRPRVGGDGGDACFGTARGGGEMERFEWRRGTYLGGAALALARSVD